MSTYASDVADAARLVAFGMRPALKSIASEPYTALVHRYRQDDGFRETVLAVTTGMDLVVLDVNDPHGIVLGPVEGSVFAQRMTDYAKRVSGPSHERVLHALAYLGAAAMAYPRPADLADPSYVNRVTVNGVEEFMRDAVTRLDEAERERAAQPGHTRPDIPAGRPDLEEAWRVYRRRASAPSSTDGRRVASGTVGIVGRTLEYLSQHGLLRKESDAKGGTYRTTSRFSVQVRDAAGRMFGELIALGVAEVSDGRGSLVRLEWTDQSLGLF